MQKFTHIIISLGLMIFLLGILGYNIFIRLLLGSMAILVAISPDWIDFKLFKGLHRNWWTHSPISPLMFFIVFSLTVFSMFFINLTFHVIFILLTISWESHVLLDSFTKTGIPFFPFTDNVNLGQIAYDNNYYNMILSLFGVLLLSIGFLV